MRNKHILISHKYKLILKLVTIVAARQGKKQIKENKIENKYGTQCKALFKYNNVIACRN